MAVWNFSDFFILPDIVTDAKSNGCFFNLKPKHFGTNPKYLYSLGIIGNVIFGTVWMMEF